MQPLALSEHERVRVTVEAGSGAGALQQGADQATPPGGSLAERIIARAHSLPSGALNSVPDDLAAEHDHYLYGAPKQSE